MKYFYYFDSRKRINMNEIIINIIESGTQKYGYELKTTLSTVRFVYNIEYNFQFTLKINVKIMKYRLHLLHVLSG